MPVRDSNGGSAPVNFAPDRHSSAHCSDADDGNRGWKSVRDRPEVAFVGGEHSEAALMRDCNHMDVHDVRPACRTRECTYGVRVPVEQRHYLAATQETAKLSLTTGPTRLRDDRRGRHGNNSELEPHPMISPHGAIGPVGSDQCAGVVDDSHADRARRGRLVICDATRARAAASSESVNGPCWASHSATAASPSRINSWRARRWSSRRTRSSLPLPPLRPPGRARQGRR